MKIEYRFAPEKAHLEALETALKGNTFIEGPQVERFEHEIAEFYGVKHAVCMSSGTSALHIALLTCGVKPKDNVLTVTNSFISSADSILFVGANPVFLDAEKATYNMDCSLIPKLNSEIQAIMVVHFGGHPTDMDPVLALAKEKGIPLIEDAAQSFGAKYKGKLTGTMGDLGVLSFVHHKHVTVFGDGGAIITNSDELAERARMLSDHGRGRQYFEKDAKGVPKMINEILGYNFRLSEMHAALGRVSLDSFKRGSIGLEKRRANVGYYRDNLSQLAFLKQPTEEKWALHSYLRYLMLAPDRDGLYSYLKQEGISSHIHYRVPIHLQPTYASRYGFKPGSFPVTEWYSNSTISLPLCPPGYSEEELAYVVSAIKRYYSEHPPKASLS